MNNSKGVDLAKIQIDENLRKIFEEDAGQDLPAELLSLLDRLDEVAVPAAFDTPHHDQADEPETDA